MPHLGFNGVLRIVNLDSKFEHIMFSITGIGSELQTARANILDEYHVAAESAVVQDSAKYYHRFSLSMNLLPMLVGPLCGIRQPVYSQGRVGSTPVASHSQKVGHAAVELCRIEPHAFRELTGDFDAGSISLLYAPESSGGDSGHPRRAINSKSPFLALAAKPFPEGLTSICILAVHRSG